MNIDRVGLEELIVESQDLQSDAMSTARGVLPDLRDIAADRRGDEPDPAALDEFAQNRRRLVGRLAAGGLLAGVFGGPITRILMPTAAAAQGASGVDVQMLQTASSLERLAVATYQAAIGLPFIAQGNAVVLKFAQTTMGQHDEHKKAFQAQTKALGGKEQDAPNPKYAPVVEQAKPTLKGPADVVKLAATLENVARDTYLADLALFTDKTSMSLMATVMGVETQHLAILRAVGALVAANAPQLIAIPVDASKLPAAAGSVGFPDAIPEPKLASPPAEGAVK